MQDFTHPADRLVQAIDRVYRRGLTTTSGGNLSVIDGEGNIWITPSGIDKGALTRADIMRVAPDGTATGPHKPSMELPFHSNVYRARPDIRAVLHAHAPTLVALSLTCALPRPDLLPRTLARCGAVTVARYAIPGSLHLGDLIVEQFARGFDAVMMDNHGICVGAATMGEAFQRLDALETCARAQLLARHLGAIPDAPETPFAPADLPSFRREAPPSSRELLLRQDMVGFSARAYRQGLFDAAQGVLSARVGEDAFLITPRDADSALLSHADPILIDQGRCEAGRVPAREAALFRAIYATHPDVRAIFAAAPPHVAAFAIAHAALDPRTIPESYIQLRDMAKLPYAGLTDPTKVASAIAPRSPALLVENYGILATGKTLTNAFDRVEVAEATAQSLLLAREAGEIRLISGAQIADIDEAFGFY